MGDVDALLERHTPEVQATFAAAIAVVRDVMPEAAEQLDLPDRAALSTTWHGRPSAP